MDTSSKWEVVDEQGPVLTWTYSFGPGLATALAVGSPTGFIVVSPPGKNADVAISDLTSRGPVRALIASNGFHHLGINPWVAACPDAKVYAPSSALPRLRKKVACPIHPLAELGSTVPHEFIDLPHMKMGEVLVKLHLDSGPLWYFTDVVTNMPKAPTHWLMGRLFRWTDSVPGLKFNNFVSLFIVKDKPALKAYLRDAVTHAPPKHLLFSHGAALTCAAGAPELIATLGG